jgi:hypothetical protein
VNPARVVAGLAALSLLLVSTWTGLRLIGVWWRTRRPPELLVGLGLIGTGPLGFGLSIVAERVPSAETAVGSPLRCVSTVCRLRP